MSNNKFREMSQLEEQLLSFLQTKVNQLSPGMSIQTDPLRNNFLKKELYKLRDEFSDGNCALVLKRRARLKEIFLQDSMDLKNLMKEIGYAYIPTQP